MGNKQDQRIITSFKRLASYMGTDCLLEVKGLKTFFPLSTTTVKAVDDVSFTVRNGEVLGIVGESGSGKSTIGLTITRLLAWPGKIVAGEILFENKDLTKVSQDEMRKIRGAKIATVFQDPITSLNPVFTV